MSCRRALPQVPLTIALSQDASTQGSIGQMNVASSELYVRQATVPSIGPDGLTVLRSATVAVAGVGGVGSTAAYYLARSGIGRLSLIDQDIVEPSNLQRIHSATRQDLFHPKAEILARTLSEFDPSTRIDAVVETITDSNIERLLEDVDLVLDGLDNFRTRYILNNFAIRSKTPYLFLSAVAEQAHSALLNPPNTPCLECIMPDVSDRFEESCETLGVSPIITGLAGAIGASTAIQFLQGAKTRLTDEMLTVDIAGSDFLYSKLSKKKGCAACSDLSNHERHSEPPVTLLCGEHTANALPPERMQVRLSSVSSGIPTEAILAKSDSVLVYRQGPRTISLFKTGRILIGGIDNEAEASRVANGIWRNLRESGLYSRIDI